MPARLLGGASTQPPSASSAAPSPAPRRRSVRAWAAGIAGLAALVAAGGWLQARRPNATVPAAQGSSEAGDDFVLRRNDANRWVVDVSVRPSEREKLQAGASKLGLVAVVTPAGFFLGAVGAILSGIPREEGAGLDYTTCAGKLREAKNAFPLERTIVVVCQTGVGRADCDRVRLLAAEDSRGPLFPEQFLVEGEFAPGYQKGGAVGIEVRFTEGLMPARQLTPARLAALRALYPAAGPAPDAG